MKKSSFMIVSFIISILFFISTKAIASVTPAPPKLTVNVDGTRVTVAWTKVQNATGYILYYAPYPKMTPVNSADMGDNNLLIVDLPIGSAYYVAVQGYNGETKGFLSNITYFIVGDNILPSVNNGSCENIAGNWLYSQIYYGEGCGLSDWDEVGPIEIRQDGCEVTVVIDERDYYYGTVQGNEVFFHGQFYIDDIKLVEKGQLTISTNRKMRGNSKVTVPEYNCTMDSYIEIIR